jgi:hypothetical protein
MVKSWKEYASYSLELPVKIYLELQSHHINQMILHSKIQEYMQHNQVGQNYKESNTTLFPSAAYLT